MFGEAPANEMAGVDKSGEDEQYLSRGCRGPRLRSNYNAGQVESQPLESGPGRLFKRRRDLEEDVLRKCHFDGGTVEGHLLGDRDDSPGKGHGSSRNLTGRGENTVQSKHL